MLDETGSKLKDMLRKCYALCGERAVSRRMLVRGQVSTIAAICTEGLRASNMTTGSVNGELFRGDLVPELLPFDGWNPKSVVIMDNCSIHHI